MGFALAEAILAIGRSVVQRGPLRTTREVIAGEFQVNGQPIRLPLWLLAPVLGPLYAAMGVRNGFVRVTVALVWPAALVFGVVIAADDVVGAPKQRTPAIVVLALVCGLVVLLLGLLAWWMVFARTRRRAQELAGRLAVGRPTLYGRHRRGPHHGWLCGTSSDAT